ncbi:MAG: alpha/beta fold hydrolase [Pseudomonadota bacterium]|nr:alpha/beta fold hydrolase [Pseudomonadota bacterium]
MPTSAPRWLLLRGLVRERRHWGGFPEQLAARTGAEVLTLDLPGVGTERDRPSPTSIAAIVADLRARWLAARALAAPTSEDTGPWRLFAPSLGGMIALAWGEAHPDDFAGVVVCNTSARDVASLFDRFSPAALGTVLRALPARGAAREAHILGLVSNTEHGRARAEAFAALSKESPIGTDVLVRQLWAGSRAVAPQSLAVPLLVLCSDGDRLCHPRASHALGKRLDAPVRVHPDAGHDLPLDDPGWVMDQMVGWDARRG